MTKMTREEWLNQVALRMAPWYAELGRPLPRYRVSIGFPSKGSRGKAIGECWTFRASADDTYEIFIRPDRSDSLEVAAILCHELVHAAVGLECGHKGPFRRLAVALGLEGPMRATVAGEGFKLRIKLILAELGPIPHAALGFGASSGPKKQSTRMIKCICSECGYTTRTARKWLDEVGPPVCPKDDHGPMVAELPQEGDDTGELQAV